MTFEEIQQRLEPYADEKKATPGVGWTPERTERARELWREGLSASQIARALGGVSRNAVIGRMHRLGESGRSTPHRTVSGPVRAGIVKARKKFLQKRARILDKEKALRIDLRVMNGPRVISPQVTTEPLPQTEELFIPLEQRKGVLDLKDNDCRWPIGDPQSADFHFCGHPKHAAFVYCEFHARKAYAQPMQRAPEAIHRNFPSPVKVARKVA